MASNGIPFLSKLPGIGSLFGNKTRVRFAEIVENKGVPASAFTFEAPAGAEVLDLR